MSFGPSRRSRDLIVEITPMIDVVFLLIIFFMTTAQFSRMTRAEVDLPRERGEQQEPDEAGTVINILADGTLQVFTQTVSVEELRSMIRAEVVRAQTAAEAVKVTLRVDRNTNAGYLNEVVNILTELGVGGARLATEVPR